MPKILLVDDDEFYRNALKTALLRSGHEVIEAGDGAEAKQALGIVKVDLVISDIRMPNVNGVELLHWIKSISELPVILITGFSEILESQKAAELGANDFLLKPFKSSDIEAAISRVLSASAQGSDADMDEDFRKVPLEDFVAGSKIGFNIYLRISNSKYVKVAYRGEDIAVDRIRSYKEKGLKYLFLSKEDFARYVCFAVDLAKKVSGTSQISEEKKRNFLRYTAEVVLEQVFVPGADAEVYETAKDFAMTALELAVNSDEIMSLLDSLNSHADFLYAHSLGVSIYGAMIAKTMQWASAPTLFKISLAGMLHDIGLKEVPRSILEKSRISMSQEERGVYESHPNRSMELLNQVKGISTDTILISFQHHEEMSGFGYPKKITASKIHPLARVIGAADVFCYYTIKNPSREERMSAGQAIAEMERASKRSLDPGAIRALKRIYKIGGESSSESEWGGQLAK